MRIGIRTATLAAALSAVFCGFSKMSVIRPQRLPTPAMAGVANAPGFRVLGEAVGVEPSDRSMTTIGVQQAVAIVGRAGLRRFEPTTTKGFALHL